MGDSTIRIGPAGWSYEDWHGTVYPAGVGKGMHPLELLSEWFDLVEVNSTFYRPIRPATCASWLKKIEKNPRFVFTAKLWQRFTHERETRPAPEEIAAFKQGLEPLRESDKLRALLLQFPWSFRRTKENRVWLERVVDAFQEYPLAIEVRHDSWETPEFLEALKARGIAFCNIDQPLFDHSIRAGEHVTAPIAYVRFHGRNRENWFRSDAGRDERYDYLYDEAELKPWIAKILSMRRMASELFVVTNNHYRGQAVVNALEIQHALGIQPRALPTHLLQVYPRLQAIFAPEPRT